MIDLPDTVRAKARLAGADDWLAGLPGLVDELAGRWSLTMGRSFQGGTEAFVAEATRADGTPAVLKLMIPRAGDHARHEIVVLRLADGDGCARLLEADEGLGAMLIERLGPSLADLDRPLPERLEILTGAAQRIWRPIPDGLLPTAVDKALWLDDFITRRWAERDRPCTERTVDHARMAIRNRIDGYAPDRAVLVHGDVHQWNALRSADGFKLVDPDGLHAEPEYDLGILMREDPVELMEGDPWDRARRLAASTGTDATAIWEWGVAERVSTGLVLTGIGLQPLAAQMLGVADEISQKW
ncbi:aminoglycoside phosphotransferase family protein [Actinoplanes sp. NPDC051633]|uniref:aminoglycoside phosphotransferase family protein n=1 Tax=Actinoplanes sp. NPDC051633 TaxID=3155670 RepID=UPI00341236EE